MSESISQIPPSPDLPEAPEPRMAANLGQPPALMAPRLRLWPVLVILVLQWLIMLVPGWVVPRDDAAGLLRWAPGAACGGACRGGMVGARQSCELV